MSDVLAAAAEFAQLGYDPIPLRHDTKLPIGNGWEKRDPLRLWRHVSDGVNIGLRGGGEADAAFLDCDEKARPGTYETAKGWLAGLGFLPGDYPVVQTASGAGRHVYLTFTGTLAGSYRDLAAQFGAGEFRFGAGAFVVAAPSQVGGMAYALVGGDYRQLPRIATADVLPILTNRTTELALETTTPTIPRRALALLHGQGIDQYKTRSEAEQALVTSLVNAGWDFDGILALFHHHQAAGKFSEIYADKPVQAMRWLKTCYEKANAWTSKNESPARQKATAALQWAEKNPWPGRTGAVDRAVFTAHASIAYKAGKITYQASVRQVAELAGIGFNTAARSAHRLIETGLLDIVTPAAADCANVYKLGVEQTGTLPHSSYIGSVPVCSHDVFRWKGLGKSAAEIWRVLQECEEPATVKTLSSLTGRHEDTVKRALRKMAALVDTVTGELCPMVEEAGGEWRACDVDLALIAQVIGTAGTGDRQKEQHAKERRQHRRALMVNRKG